MKKLTLFISSLALFAVSCSTDEVDTIVGNDVNSENVIGFFANTTRVGISTIDNIKASDEGFSIYATNDDNDASWNTNINGGNNYRYGTPVGSDSKSWGWSGVDVKWPTEDEKYPMNFYAYFPDVKTLPNGVASVSSTPAQDIKLSYAVPEAIGDQIDYLAASATTDARPKGDKLALAFDHILSKVSIQVVPGYETIVYMPQAGVANVNSTATYDVMTGKWGDTDVAKSHDLLSVKEAMMTFEGTDQKEETASVIKADDFLMLMPQTDTPTWAHVSGDAPSNAYISMLYRVTSKDGDDIIGYTKAENHPSYKDSDENKMYAGKALYVKAGYPIQKDTFSWTKGLSYVYNIHLATDGATNGYLLDNNYYDEDGNLVNLKIDDKEPGDPVTDGCIDFTVTVGNWGSDNVFELGE